MISCCGGDWTAVAMDEVFPAFFLKSSRAAQFFENAECTINSLLSRFATQLGQMFIGHGLSSRTHSGAQISGFDLPREYRHEKRDQSPVRLRKQLFRFRAEGICGVGFAKSALHA